MYGTKSLFTTFRGEWLQPTFYTRKNIYQFPSVGGNLGAFRCNFGFGLGGFQPNKRLKEITGVPGTPRPTNLQMDVWWNTPWKFNIAPENIPAQKERIVFQPSFFRGYVKLREGNHFLSKDLVHHPNWNIPPSKWLALGFQVARISPHFFQPFSWPVAFWGFGPPPGIGDLRLTMGTKPPWN